MTPLMTPLIITMGTPSLITHQIPHRNHGALVIIIMIHLAAMVDLIIILIISSPHRSLTPCSAQAIKRFPNLEGVETSMSMEMFPNLEEAPIIIIIIIMNRRQSKRFPDLEMKRFPNLGYVVKLLL